MSILNFFTEFFGMGVKDINEIAERIISKMKTVDLTNEEARTSFELVYNYLFKEHEEQATYGVLSDKVMSLTSVLVKYIEDLKLREKDHELFYTVVITKINENFK